MYACHNVSEQVVVQPPRKLRVGAGWRKCAGVAPMRHELCLMVLNWFASAQVNQFETIRHISYPSTAVQLACMQQHTAR